jgi:hypothetical protein
MTEAQLLAKIYSMTNMDRITDYDDLINAVQDIHNEIAECFPELTEE